MFNQEQLAAIAAAMSVLHQSLQSNSPPNNQLSNGNHQVKQQQQQHHHQHHHQQQQMLFQPSPDSLRQHLAPSPPRQMHQQYPLVNQYQQHSQFHNDLDLPSISTPKQHSLADAAALAAAALVTNKNDLTANLTRSNLDEQLRQLQNQYEAFDFLSAATSSSVANSSNNIDHQPSALPTQIHANEQALVNQLQQTHLNEATHLSTANNQQYHNQPQNNLLVSNYQSQYQRRDLNLDTSAAPIINTKQHQLDLQHHQQALRSTQQLQQPPPQLLSVLNQPPATSKPSRPVSYSAIVAKAAGIDHNHGSNNHTSSSNNVANSSGNNTMNTNSIHNNNGHINALNTNHVASSQVSNNFNSIGTTVGTTNTNHHQNNGLNHSLGTNMNSLSAAISTINPFHINNSPSNNNMPSNGSATNLLGFMGLYVGNLSPDLTKEQLEKIFSKYGEPVKAHRLIRSPVAFIKYENTESPRAAIDDLYGLILPELTLNPDQPLKLHFDRNDAQLKANYRPTELPPEADNGECYGWRTTVCRRGKNCPKKHIPINRGIDFQMWMIKSSSAGTTATS